MQISEAADQFLPCLLCLEDLCGTSWILNFSLMFCLFHVCAGSLAICSDCLYFFLLWKKLQMPLVFPFGLPWASSTGILWMVLSIRLSSSSTAESLCIWDVHEYVPLLMMTQAALNFILTLLDSIKKLTPSTGPLGWTSTGFEMV